MGFDCHITSINQVFVSSSSDWIYPIYRKIKKLYSVSFFRYRINDVLLVSLQMHCIVLVVTSIVAVSAVMDNNNRIRATRLQYRGRSIGYDRDNQKKVFLYTQSPISVTCMQYQYRVVLYDNKNKWQYQCVLSVLCIY